MDAKEEPVAVLRGLGLRTLSCDEATFMVDYTVHFLLSLKPFDMYCELEKSKGPFALELELELAIFGSLVLGFHDKLSSLA